MDAAWQIDLHLRYSLSTRLLEDPTLIRNDVIEKQIGNHSVGLFECFRDREKDSLSAIWHSLNHYITNTQFNQQNFLVTCKIVPNIILSKHFLRVYYSCKSY